MSETGWLQIPLQQNMTGKTGIIGVLIAIILHISNNKKIMGNNTNGTLSNVLGGFALLLMTVAAGILIYLMIYR